MVSYRNGVCPRAAFVARLDMARFTRVRVLRWVQHSRPVQLVLLPAVYIARPRVSGAPRAGALGKWHGEFARPYLQSNRRSVGLGVAVSSG